MTLKAKPVNPRLALISYIDTPTSHERAYDLLCNCVDLAWCQGYEGTDSQYEFTPSDWEYVEDRVGAMLPAQRRELIATWQYRTRGARNPLDRSGHRT